MTSIRGFLTRYPTDDEVQNPPILIPTFNNGRYLNNFIAQLEQVGLSRYVVLDGGSNDETTCELLEELEQQGRVIRLKENPGPRFFFQNKRFFRQLPTLFCVSDPDLEFNAQLPTNFLEHLATLSEEMREGKVGFALSLEGEIIEDPFFFGKRKMGIKEWEAQFWREPLKNSLGLEVFRARIDTTFALYNKKYLSHKYFFEAIRVAGSYTARHLPWYRDNPLRSKEPGGSTLGRFSTWDVEKSAADENKALEDALDKILKMENSLSWKLTSPLRSAYSAIRSLARKKRH